MAIFNKFNQFVEDRNHGVHNLSSHAIKVMLTNTAPVATDAVKADLVEIAAGNGYPAGGPALTKLTTGQVGGVYTFDVQDEVIEAAGGSIGPFSYVVIYNDTPTSPADPLICWFDYGSELTLADGESLTVDFDDVDGLFTDS